MEDRKHPCRRELLDWINVVSFAADDTKLFLDTHPANQEGLKCFDALKKQRTEALKEYARYYGPLTLDTAAVSSDRWCWINEPWPWQEGGC